MLTVMPIRSIAYHDAQADETERQTAIFRSDEASRNLTCSYYDQDISGARGQWLLLGSAAQFPNSIFSEIVTGAPVNSRQLHALAAGAAITEGRSLRSYSGDRRAGYDSVFSAPKSVSILTTLGDHNITRAIINAHESAVKQTMDHAFLTGCIEIRTGSAGRFREAASACAAAMYTHFLSRENDPQLHTHVVVLNAGLRDDGTVSAVDNLKFMRMRAVLGARYRAALANNLYLSLGLESENIERNFELVDIDDSLNKLFSKRKRQIDDYVVASGKTTTKDRVLAQQAAYDTRRKKQTGLLLPQLQKDWQRQIGGENFSPEEILRIVKSRAASPTITPDGRNQLLRQKAAQAIDNSAALSCAISASNFEQIVFEAGQAHGSVTEIEAVAEALSKKFITDIRDNFGGKFHIVKESVQLEHMLLRTARMGRKKWRQSASAINTIDQRLDLSEMQRAAALHALNSDLISVVEGAPGSGKSYLIGAVASALRASGFKITVTAPSHKAKAVIRDETKTNDAQALPIQTLAARLHDGTLSFHINDVVIIDEAGMAALDDVNEVVQAAAKVGAKIIVSGDTRQLQPVAAGAPMLSLSQLLGSARVDEIRRQKAPWMREASQDLATNNFEIAIQEYRDRGLLKFFSTSNDTLSSAADHAMDFALRETQLSLTEAIPFVMTHRRKDVLALNSTIREKLKMRGALASSIVIEAMMRGDNRATQLEIAVGDKIVFGEKLEPRGVAINNGDIAFVTGITQTANSEPVLHLKMNRNDPAGRPITFSSQPRDLVGKRNKGMLRVPKIQHAYAQTIYAGQGATVDHAILVCAAKTSAEQILVGMTRHRLSLNVLVSAEHLLPQKSQRQMMLKKDGEIVNIDVEHLHNALSETDEAQALQRFIREASERERKYNPSDFIKDVEAWLDENDAIDGFRKWHQPTQIDSFKARMKRVSMAPRRKASMSRKSGDAFNARELKQIEAAHLNDQDFIRDISLEYNAADETTMATGLAPMNAFEDRSNTLNRLTTLTKTAIRDKLQLWVLNPIAAALKRIDDADYARRVERSAQTIALQASGAISAQQQVGIKQLAEIKEYEDMIRSAARRRQLMFEILNTNNIEREPRPSEIRSSDKLIKASSLAQSNAKNAQQQPPAKSKDGWLEAGLKKLLIAGRDIVNARVRNRENVAAFDHQKTGRDKPPAVNLEKSQGLLVPTNNSGPKIEREADADKHSTHSIDTSAPQATTEPHQRIPMPVEMPKVEELVFDIETNLLMPEKPASNQPRLGTPNETIERPAPSHLQPVPSQTAGAITSPVNTPKNSASIITEQNGVKRPPVNVSPRPSPNPRPPGWRPNDDGRGM
jgi:conjugative relaxase-like TrwC/TraI family protein